MSFLIPCPNCGERDANEFRYGGESRERPEVLDDDRVWAEYVFGRENSPGEQREWWFHRLGCRRWFVAVRNLTSNQVLSSEWVRKPSSAADSQEPTS
jgi:heterotetrameric sarcosine oxidase delta subunit